MNAWSAIVLITMTLVVGAAVYFTSSPLAIWGLVPMVYLGK